MVHSGRIQPSNEIAMELILTRQRLAKLSRQPIRRVQSGSRHV